MNVEHQFIHILSTWKNILLGAQSLLVLMKSYGVHDKIIRAIRGIYEGFECAVIEENETSERSQMPGLFFLLAIRLGDEEIDSRGGGEGELDGILLQH